MAGDVPYSSVMEVPLRAIRALKLLNLTRNKQLLHEVQNTVAGYQTMCCIVTNSNTVAGYQTMCCIVTNSNTVAGYQTMCCVVTNSLHFSARLRPI